jgi:hypothetical protein
MTDWYIDQMKTKTYPDPLPISLHMINVASWIM